MTVHALSRQLYKTMMFVVLIHACALWLDAQPTLQITSPSDGAVFSPGQTITVTVTASGSGFSSVFVIGQDPLGFSARLSAPPYQFSLPIPASAVPRQYKITAAGVITAGEPVYSPSVTIAVQRSDPPVSVRVEPNILELKVGQKGYLQVTGT